MIQETQNPTPLSTLWLTSFFVKPEICDFKKEMLDASDIHFSNFSSMYNSLLSFYKADALVSALISNTAQLQSLYLSDVLAQICYNKAKLSSFGYRLSVEELNDILKMLSILPLPNLSNRESYENSISNLIEHYQGESLLGKTPLLTENEFEKCRLGSQTIVSEFTRFYTKAQNSTASIFFRLSLPTNFEKTLDDVLTAVVYTYCMMKDNLAKKQTYFELPSSYLKRCLTIYTHYSKTLSNLKDLLENKKSLLEQIKAKANNSDLDSEMLQTKIENLNEKISNLVVALDGHHRDYNGIFAIYVRTYNSIQNVKKIYTYLEQSSKTLQKLRVGFDNTTAALQGLGFQNKQFARWQLGTFGLVPQEFDFFAELDARIQGLIGITEALDETELPAELSTEIKKQLRDLETDPLDILGAGKCEKPIVDKDAMNLKRLLVGSLAVFGISVLYGMTVRSKKKRNKKIENI